MTRLLHSGKSIQVALEGVELGRLCARGRVLGESGVGVGSLGLV
jgi:hypothetical protein